MPAASFEIHSDAGSCKNAAGVVAVMSQLIGRSADTIWSSYRSWLARRRTNRVLAGLDERTLRDIGVDRTEIEYVLQAIGPDSPPCRS